MVSPQFKFAQLLLALRRVIRNDHLVLMVLALVVGCASGAAVVLFREAIDLVQMAVYGTDHDRLSMHVARLPWWQVLLAPAAGGLVVGLFIYFFKHSFFHENDFIASISIWILVSNIYCLIGLG